MPVERITLFCFAASYGVALVVEVANLFWPRPVQRLMGLAFGAAGLLAHTLYLLVRWPALETPFGSLLLLAWIVAVFGLSGSVHHRRFAWGVFVLPLVCGLVGLAAFFPRPTTPTPEGLTSALGADARWSQVHGLLVLLAAVGVSIGFVASVVYLFHARQLKAKVPPGHGPKLLSLERLETMNRWALNLAFPLLTAGALVGVGQLVRRPEHFAGWADPKILGTTLLWIVLALLLYLRYGYHVRGRRLALLTILAFVLLVGTLVSTHAIVEEGLP